MTVRKRGTPRLAKPSPPPSDGVDIVGACRRLHASIDRLDEFVATTVGVSRSDLRCLNLLEFGPLPATAIAKQLNLATGSVTALIDRLEKKGLVARLREGSDRRVVKVLATAKVFELVGPIYLGFADQLRRLVVTYPLGNRQLAVKHLLDVAQICELELAARSGTAQIPADSLFTSSAESSK